jgi:hypothetical protein
MRTVEAVGAMGRGTSVVIVGDPKQLSPAALTDAVSSARPGVAAASKAEPESILKAALDSGLPRLRLKWHYRSENEELFAFPNSRYYGNELAVLPSSRRDAHAGISWRQLNGELLRGEGANPIEARALVEELAARLRDPAKRDESMGVLCLNVAQRDLILDMLEEFKEPLFREALSVPDGRRLFVKCLEHAQGEECDVILMSLALSPEPASKMLPLDCGPLSSREGERLLNVALTRARKQVRLLTSFGPEHIDPQRAEMSPGVRDLRDYLTFAATSGGTMPEAPLPGQEHGILALEIAKALEASGYITQTNVGHSAFRVDLAAKKPGDKGWRLAIMLDGPGWKSQLAVVDRDGVPSLLKDVMHWPAVTRLWLPAWLRNRKEQVKRLVGLLESSSNSRLSS